MKKIALIDLQHNSSVFKELKEKQHGVDDIWLIGNWVDSEFNQLDWNPKTQNINILDVDQDLGFKLMKRAVAVTERLAQETVLEKVNFWFEDLFADKDGEVSLIAKFACGAIYDWLCQFETIWWLKQKHDDLEVWISENYNKEFKLYRPVLDKKYIHRWNQINWRVVNQQRSQYKSLVFSLISDKFKSKPNLVSATKQFDLAVYLDPRSRNYWFDQSNKTREQLCRNPLFLIDGSTIKKNNALIVIPSLKDQSALKKLRRFGYQVIELSYLSGRKSPPPLKKMPDLFIRWLAFWHWETSLPGKWRDFFAFVNTRAKIWQHLMSKYEFKRLVSWDDYYSGDFIIRSLILKKHGANNCWLQTTHSFLNSHGEFYPGDAFSWIWAPESLVTGESAQEHFERSNCLFAKQLKIGFVGASLVEQRKCELKRGGLKKNALLKKMQQKMGDKRVVAVFDEFFVSHARARIFDNSESAEIFWADLVWLTQKRQDLFFLIKPKRDLSNGQFISGYMRTASPLPKYWQILKQASNVIMVDNWFDPYLVMALSQVVISDYVSTATTFFEAIGAGLGSFYYLTDRKAQVIKDLPKKKHLIARGRKVLLTTINFWLENAENSEYKLSVKKSLQKFDQFGDDQALNRFKQYLQDN